MQEDSVSVRETLKDKHFFDKLIQANEKSLQRFNAVIANPETTAVHRRRLRHTIFRRELEQLIARYSRGDSIIDIQKSFTDIVVLLSNYHKEEGHSPFTFDQFDNYVVALWLVSLATLFDVEDKVFHDLLHELNNEGQDVLYERLVGLRVPARSQSNTLLYPKPYRHLFDALNTSGEQQTRLIQRFLKDYYNGMKKAYWHNMHQSDDTSFFGYWCFELAAFTKVLRVDDRAFADNAFYPKDLARYNT